MDEQDVIKALAVTGDAGRTPGPLVDGLVTQERSRRKLIDRAHDRMNGLMGYLTENCCQGASCAVPIASCC